MATSTYIGVSTLRGIKGVWLKDSDRRVLVFAGAVLNDLSSADAKQLGDMVKPYKTPKKSAADPVTADETDADVETGGEEAEDGPSMTAEDVDGMLEGNAVDIAKAIASIDNVEDLKALQKSEKKGKQRSTVLTAIDARLSNV